MQVNITARHIQIPETVKALLISKIEHLERFGHKLNSVHAIFDRERYFYTAEVTLSMKGQTLVGKAKDPKDILTCMEEAIMKVKQQLKRRQAKQRVEVRRRVPHRPA